MVLNEVWKKSFVLLALLFVGIGGTYATYRFYMIPSENSAGVKQGTLGVEPKRIDEPMGTKPTGFPTDIPMEEGATVTEGYSLEYPDQKQLSVAFPSRLSVAENYTKYTAYLQGAQWEVQNVYESEEVSSLYAVQPGSSINITLQKNELGETKSVVRISILKN